MAYGWLNDTEAKTTAAANKTNELIKAEIIPKYWHVSELVHWKSVGQS